MTKTKIMLFIPEGWVVKKNGNAPIGYELICNNRSMFDGEYKSAYVKKNQKENS